MMDNTFQQTSYYFDPSSMNNGNGNFYVSNNNPGMNGIPMSNVNQQNGAFGTFAFSPNNNTNALMASNNNISTNSVGNTSVMSSNNPNLNNNNNNMGFPMQMGMMQMNQVWTPIVSGNNTAFQGEFEVHDSQLKAPITIRPTDVIATAGSQRLFSNGTRQIVYGSKNMFRICENFQEGNCLSANCPEVHVNPEYLKQTRQALTTWLQEKENEFNRDFVHHPDKLLKIFVADVKEIVEVPISALVFTKGLYVDPSTRFKRTRGVAPSYNAAIAAQVPTGCGLYSSDPTQCKWGRWCNQVHISPDWMKSKKKNFDSWFDEIEGTYLSYPPEHLFTVHDPQLKRTLQIPKWSVVSFSRGLFQGSDRKAPSVCLLFQKSRCTAGACCNQIHVSTHYLNLVRTHANNMAQVATTDGYDPAYKNELDQLMETLTAVQKEEEQKRRAEREQEKAQKTKEEKKKKEETATRDDGESLFEYIAVDDEADVETSRSPPHADGNSSKAGSKKSAGGSYSNNPYSGSLTDLLFQNPIVIGGVPTERNANSVSSFKRTPAASLTCSGEVAVTSSLSTHHQTSHTTATVQAEEGHPEEGDPLQGRSVTSDERGRSVTKVGEASATSWTNLRFNFDSSVDTYPSVTNGPIPGSPLGEITRGADNYSI
ncbi:hypothetical protein AGDE_15044 [Angomonas deanei]|uniref:C3H1-type domain-containing protein n=1 Tax=Angomonas deanei TaxID=59799 RepID=A0A7G2C2Z8_9TRYP|nr:hypothetical protein AGDE_15044 [Angomonas deanei]CAD2214168.1 hypothetical protein, conserved [Angomonas deanei]|eukprot:EPY19775.1 hypothetical protein AGDE_15044 [Angomonas deanei]